MNNKQKLYKCFLNTMLQLNLKDRKNVLKDLVHISKSIMTEKQFKKQVEKEYQQYLNDMNNQIESIIY